MNKRIVLLTLLALIWFGFIRSALGNYKPENFKGIWEGTLKFSGTELRVVFKISEKPNGNFTATMDSPDQGATNIPVSEVIIDNKKLHLNVKAVFGIYEGELQEDGLSIKGEWKQSGLTLPLLLKKVKKIPEVRRPQEPKKPYPYNEEEVFYENKKAGIKLAGTLTLPEENGPFPGVLLISGSGAQDRNETIFGHHPFLVLADYLTRQGIAVLRVDDRGIGKSTGDFSKATTLDFASDVVSGIEFLKSRKEIDKKRIGLIGHSEGGIIAPKVACESPDVAFIVLLAAPGFPGDKILEMQTELIAKAQKLASEEEIMRAKNLNKQIYLIIKQEEDNKIAEKKIRKIIEDALAETPEKEREAMGKSETMIDKEIQQLLSPWFRFFLSYDPKPALKKIKFPVLAINGEKDLQVPPEENLTAIEEAFKAGGNKNYIVKELPGLNHLFQKATTGLPAEYGQIEETFSPTALKLIGDWIKEQTK